MPYYEMSLENGREYVYQNNFSVSEHRLGLWLIVFSDVEWDNYEKQAGTLRLKEQLLGSVL